MFSSNKNVDNATYKKLQLLLFAVFAIKFIFLFILFLQILSLNMNDNNQFNNSLILIRIKEFDIIIEIAKTLVNKLLYHNINTIKPFSYLSNLILY